MVAKDMELVEGFESFDWPEEEVDSRVDTVVDECYHWVKATFRNCLVSVKHLQWHLTTRQQL